MRYCNCRPYIQFELTEVTRLILIQIGNEANTVPLTNHPKVFGSLPWRAADVRVELGHHTIKGVTCNRTANTCNVASTESHHKLGRFAKVISLDRHHILVEELNGSLKG